MESQIIERDFIPIELETEDVPGVRKFRIEEMTGSRLTRYIDLCNSSFAIKGNERVKLYLGQGKTPVEAMDRAANDVAAGAHELLAFCLSKPTDGLPAPTIWEMDPERPDQPLISEDTNLPTPNLWLKALSKGQARKIIAFQDEVNGLHGLLGNLNKVAEEVMNAQVAAAEAGQNSVETSEGGGE